jgi:prevent-host-death family protein
LRFLALDRPKSYVDHTVTTTVGIRELKRDAARLVKRAAKGQSILVTRYGKPEAKLVPADRPIARAPSPRGERWNEERLAFERIEPSLRARYRGNYVAVSGGRIVGSGKSAEGVARVAWKALRGEVFFVGRVGEAQDTVELPGFEVL